MNGTRALVRGLMELHLRSARQNIEPFPWMSHELSNRPWFRRVWCIQECTNARTATFQCGTFTVDFTKLAVVRVYMQLFGLFLHGRLGDDIVTTASGTPEEQQSESRQRLVLAESLRGFVPTTIIDLRMKCLASSNHGVGPGHNLKHYLDQTSVRNFPYERRVKATNDIDLVYALLGVASDDAAKAIIPDYEISCEEAYIMTARVLLNHGHDDLLSLCRRRGRTGNVPSWTPDWTAALRTPWSVFNRENWSFHACGQETETPAVKVSAVNTLSRYLVLRGVMVDTIHETGHIFSLAIDQQPNADFWQSLRPFFCNISEFLSESDQYSSHHKKEAEWRIPIGDGHIDDLKSEVVRAEEGSHMKMGYEYARAIYGWTQSGSATVPSEQPTLAYACFIDQFKRMYDSRPFITKTGYVGLCPKETEPGDRIAIFMGVRVPYIIRQHSCSDYRWNLIGESHAYGLRDGEIMKEDPLVESITLM